MKVWLARVFLLPVVMLAGAASLVADGSVTITTSSVSNGETNVAYPYLSGQGFVFSATGGTGSYTWSEVIPGSVPSSLPRGLPFFRNEFLGVLMEGPTTAETYPFTVEATEICDCTPAT